MTVKLSAVLRGGAMPAAGMAPVSNGTDWVPTQVQPKLVSNVNIKTINGVSLLGPENLIVKGGLAPTAVKVADYRAVANDLVRVNSTNGVFNVWAPASPVDGDRMAIFDIANMCGTHVVSFHTNDLDASPATIENDATYVDINIDGAYMEIMYVAATNNWKVMESPLLAISDYNMKTINGQSLFGAGDLVIAASGGSSVNLVGNSEIYIGQTIAYTITDYDSFSTYDVTVTAGSVSRTGSSITFVAPETAGNVTMAVTTNGTVRNIVLTVLPASIAAPAVSSPVNASTGVIGPDITFTSNAFSWLGVVDSHLNSDWQLATDAAFTTIVQSASASTTSKTSWTTTVNANTTYYVRVRHRGTASGVSPYSATVTFSTAASFSSYIATPTATPAAFGDSFEGGFYTGTIWNELTQSSGSSVVIATGNKGFVVADMTSAPIVYSGQLLEVRSRANPENKMIGVVTSAIGTMITINVTSIGGSGTFSDWSIMAQYRIIVAPKASGENASMAFKTANDAAPSACITLTEGRKATLAMVAAGTSTVYPAAHWCNNLSIAGRTDWYLPARDELELCWRNLKPTTNSNYVGADRPGGAAVSYMNLGSYGDVANTHGLDNNSSPVGAAYSSGTPAQVAAGKNFRTSESEAFACGSFNYWSASEYSATHAWCQNFGSSYPGYQGGGNKTFVCYARAVRRSII